MYLLQRGLKKNKKKNTKLNITGEPYKKLQVQLGANIFKQNCTICGQGFVIKNGQLYMRYTYLNHWLRLVAYNGSLHKHSHSNFHFLVYSDQSCTR